MRNLLAVGVLCLLASGCGGVSSKAITLPDGRHGASIKCDKKHNDWGDCYNEAATYCGGKYTVLERNGSDQSVAFYNAGNPFFSTIPRRSIVVRCE